MSHQQKHSDFIHQPRRDSMYEEHLQDPFQARGKLKEPVVCPDCGVVYHQGRWQWVLTPEGAEEHRCPACSRIHDHIPAGILTLSGDFFQANKDEILRLIEHTEEKEKAEHPMERIMEFEDTYEKETIVYFTGIHLTKRTGEALRRAYKGDFNFSFSESDSVVRASWVR